MPKLELTRKQAKTLNRVVESFLPDEGSTEPLVKELVKKEIENQQEKSTSRKKSKKKDKK